MLFTQAKFALFFTIVFGLYWLAEKKYRLQNVLLLIASYIFYSLWDWRFFFLLLFSTLLDFFSGHKIYHATTRHHKKIWLTISICINLGVLVFFKYCNFFIGTVSQVLHAAGYSGHFNLLHILLPVGISFYTFHGLSYVQDVYNNKRPPTNNFIQYALFVSFFPLLMAGPIERATHLLPQIERPRTFSYSKSVNGLRQILWGLFKKLVIADNCALYVNDIYDHSYQYQGLSLLLGAVLFCFQLYGDFSGYADIALGIARMLGFEVLKNFNFPFFSRSIAEFWQRWNISLSSWFKDYVYIPLGGNRVGKAKHIRNALIVFLLSGFWHGANYTFIVWGLVNGLLVVFPVLANRTNVTYTNIVAYGKLLPSLKEVLQVLITFTLTTFAFIFFRAQSVQEAFYFITHIFSAGPSVLPQQSPVLLVLLPLFILIEWAGRQHHYAIEKLGLQWPRMLRWCFYSFIVFCIGMYKDTHTIPFIYFQF